MSIFFFTILLPPPTSTLFPYTTLFRSLLITVILTRQGAELYTAEFQRFPMKPGWNRLQSPLHYIFSWGLSEAGRASFHTAMVLRSRLKSSWVRSQFLGAVKTVFNAEMARYKLSATEVISWCFARMAHSNSVVGSP